jgi:hypothetical protein
MHDEDWLPDPDNAWVSVCWFVLDPQADRISRQHAVAMCFLIRMYWLGWIKIKTPALMPVLLKTENGQVVETLKNVRLIAGAKINPHQSKYKQEFDVGRFQPAGGGFKPVSYRASFCLKGLRGHSAWKENPLFACATRLQGCHRPS